MGPRPSAGRAPDPTQGDVARLAGVSTAVVSYVVNGGPRSVAPETAARVRLAIGELGYRPNLAARTLRLGTSRVLGLVLADVSNPFFGALGKSIDRMARAHGLDVIVGNTFGESPVRLIQHLDELQVAGIVVAVGIEPDDEPALRRLGTRIVQLDAGRVVTGGVAVAADLYAGGQLAVAHLLAHGHETVAFLGDVDPELPRYAGWRDALIAAGAPLGRAVPAEYSREGGLRSAADLVGAGPPPTAIFASSDLIAVGALLALRRAGLDVPADVSVVSFDDSPETAFACPALSAVRQPIDAMAELALAAVLDPDQLSPGRHLLPVELIERESVGAPRTGVGLSR